MDIINQTKHNCKNCNTALVKSYFSNIVRCPNCKELCCYDCGENENEYRCGG